MADTRIIIRNDNAANWSSSGATDLNKGELAFEIGSVEVPSVGTTYYAFGRLGVADGTPFDECPQVAVGSVTVTPGVVEDETTFTAPVVYEDAASKPDGTTVRWDATDEKWVADARVVTIDTYPTANGTVVYDASLGKFIVGTTVSATVIDGGSY